MLTIMRCARSFVRRREARWCLSRIGIGRVYVVLTSRNGVAVPEGVLDQIGVPGIVVKGRVLEASGVKAVAIAGLGE